jgi:hemoglobin
MTGVRIRMLVIAAVAALSTSACSGTAKPGAGRGSAIVGQSLYDRLGGKDAITGLVEDFVANVATDRRISQFFDGADMPGFRQKLVDQICEVTGGPCKYTGKEMQAAHAGMAIKDEEFNFLVEDLVKSLDKFKVAEQEKLELLALLEKMRAAIVEPPR